MIVAPAAPLTAVPTAPIRNLLRDITAGLPRFDEPDHIAGRREKPQPHHRRGWGCEPNRLDKRLLLDGASRREPDREAGMPHLVVHRPLERMIQSHPVAD